VKERKSAHLCGNLLDQTDDREPLARAENSPVPAKDSPRPPPRATGITGC
jgi:hypothetical protein